jgi:hypothetical protein
MGLGVAFGGGFWIGYFVAPSLWTKKIENEDTGVFHRNREKNGVRAARNEFFPKRC